MNCIELADTILEQTQHTPAHIWKPAKQFLFSQIAAMKRPLAHGTRTELLDGILQKGLGSPDRPTPYKDEPTFACSLSQTVCWEPTPSQSCVV